MLRVVLVLALSAVTIACGGGNSSPTAPTPPSTPAPPAIARFILEGFVRNSRTNAGIPNATVELSSTSAQTNVTATTDGNGYFAAGDVGVGGGYNVRVSANRYNGSSQSGQSFASGDTLTIRLDPFFTRTGAGNTVFDMPTNVRRVRIRGRYTQNSSNFIVRIGGRLVVNELLGTGWSTTTYDGLHLTNGGVVEITNSSGVAWEFHQEQ